MSSAVGAVARWIVPFLMVVAVAGIGVSAAPPPAIRLADDAAGGLGGQPLFVDPWSAAMAAHNADPSNPELAYIANQPQAYWIDQAVPSAAISRYVGAAQAAGTVPVLALYALPHRDCGSFAAGGFGSADAYKGFVDSVAATIGGGPAAIILEPDALDMADCLSGGQRQERFDLMSYAVDTLTRNPATAVYIDAGHSRWLSADEIAARLNQVGIGKARGFSLNTSNFFTTDEEIGYGNAVSGLTNGKPFVIDTSRNGNGPAPDGPLNWCNPSGRALGAAPTTAAGGNVDAYLWIKRPGDSDGSCGRGDPGPGHFMNSTAVELAKNAGQ